MFESGLLLGGEEFVPDDDNLFPYLFHSTSNGLWVAELRLWEMQAVLRAFRRVGRTGLIFLDQFGFLVDDSCSNAEREMVDAMSKFVKTLDRKAIEAAKRASADDPEFARLYPAVAEYLTLTSLGKEAREPSRLSVFTEDGVFKAFLNDPHTGRYVCVSAKTFTGVLEALEGPLQAGEADWRESRNGKRK